ncbi:hypothetical protein WAF17_10720 [Bernardetia sp. ABR2-2B]|uniref:hypothetical protein n=1 Tax=Bernardetia sp. ABR2-2B TaxID=3127472 RepID=UPI0030D36B7C
MNQTTHSHIPNNKNKVPCRYKLVLYHREQEQNSDGAFVDKRRTLYAAWIDHDTERILAYWKKYINNVVKNPIQYQLKYGTLKTALIIDRYENKTIWKHTVQKSKPMYFPEESEISEAYEEPKETFASEQEIKIALQQVEQCYLANNGTEMPSEDYQKCKSEFSICDSKMLENMLQFRLKMINYLFSQI